MEQRVSALERELAERNTEVSSIKEEETQEKENKTSRQYESSSDGGIDSGTEADELSEK